LRLASGIVPPETQLLNQSRLALLRPLAILSGGVGRVSFKPCDPFDSQTKLSIRSRRPSFSGAVAWPGEPEIVQHLTNGDPYNLYTFGLCAFPLSALAVNGYVLANNVDVLAAVTIRSGCHSLPLLAG
jgi:hypothetical protein